jgi:hypothetical protein
VGELNLVGDSDGALRAAIKAAVDAGLIDRAARLLELLRDAPASGVRIA